MKKFLILVCFAFVTKSYSQELSKDYVVYSVNKQIEEFPYCNDNSKPINAFITYSQILANGKMGQLRELSSYRIKALMSKSGTSDKAVSQKEKESILKRTIYDVQIYKDSVAGIVLNYTDSLYTVWYFSYEYGKWLNAGEDLGGKSIKEARNKFIKKAPRFLKIINRINDMEAVSKDTTAFANYLEKNGKPPKEYVIDALVSHKLVIYGEIHSRKVSWDLMKSVINSPEFSKCVSTIFLELSDNSQEDLDRFFTNKYKDPEIILNILRNEELFGWCDKGIYEFILDMWDLNNRLPRDKKIKVILTDVARPFKFLTTNTKEDYLNFINKMPDRDEYMANKIETYFKSSSDKRNYLFIVGDGHAYKSSAQKPFGDPKMILRSTGSILSEKLPEGSVFTICTHRPIISNNGGVYGLVRKGLFDYIFAQSGNRPVAFNLNNSPFGKEPFDASYEMCYDINTGSFQECYDGYVFLQPVKDEPSEYYLPELYSDGFIAEMKRRALIVGKEDINLYGIKIKDIVRDQFMENMKKYYEGYKRWDSMVSND